MLDTKYTDNLENLIVIGYSEELSKKEIKEAKDICREYRAKVFGQNQEKIKKTLQKIIQREILDKNELVEIPKTNKIKYKN